MKLNETKIHKYILDHSKKMLSGLEVADYEYPLFRALDLLKRETYLEVWRIEKGSLTRIIGKIDLILKYRGERLITEIKYDKPTNTSSDFWASLKVLGYTTYYKWQTGYGEKVHPAVIVPLHSIKLEQQIIAGLLKIRLFGVYEDNKELKLKFINDEKPVWKQ